MMQPNDVKNAADARRIVAERELAHVKLGLFDADGVLRGKYLAREKFLSALESGFGFCDVVLGWDSNDQLYDNVSFTGWHTAYPDACCRIVPSTCRALPLEGDMLFFLCEFDGAAEALCPRGTLKRVLAPRRGDGLRGAGRMRVRILPVRGDSPFGARKGFQRTCATSRPGSSVTRCCAPRSMPNSTSTSWRSATSCASRSKACTPKPDPACWRRRSPMRTRWKAPTARRCSRPSPKFLAQRRGWMATFMAKWSRDWPGQSGHLHISLTDKRGKPVFHDARKPHGMSDAMRWFIGGQQALLPELLAMVASNVNSYARLIPGFWAPTDATWGIDNRTCALRVITGSPKSQRVEYRIAAADINPVYRAGRGDRIGPLGHRAEDRARRAHRGQCLWPCLPRTAPIASYPVGGGAAAQGLAGGARPVRRRICRALLRPPANGRSASSAKRSRTGNWPAISRLSKGPLGLGERAARAEDAASHRAGQRRTAV